ncbi:GMP synthase [Rhodovulum sp. PH10]|uniref:glutamine amidotransferase n=1 Tax=Rhodovulum sp. PH10 TaxID=1187851 RepID=UPI00027C220A|nr:glutamine amidotransferase [Rhodovulum sp. PH10]EJW11450.1 GMP synthase [Rhodovulum sp. PH10]
MLKPVLIVLHQEQSTPGRIGHYLQVRGLPLDVRRPRFGERLPETLDEHAGAVVFGGPMSANDPDDYVRTEIEWLKVPLRERKPFLGICLGAQMLAKHLGAAVGPRPDGRVEIGYYPLRATESGRSVVPSWPDHVYQWHREGLELPAGAELLAAGDTFRVQAFRYGPAAFGVQFHPEVTHAMMCRWTTRGDERLSLPGARPRLAHFADRPVYDGAVRAWLADFLDLWLASAPEPVTTGPDNVTRVPAETPAAARTAAVPE